MSSETWALLGVVVGVVLGALAQFVADTLRRQHERSLLLRNERREAYTEFLAAVQEAVTPTRPGATVEVMEPGNEEEGRPPRKKVTIGPIPPEFGPAMDRLTVARARVELVAPKDTHEAAEDVAGQLVRGMLEDKNRPRVARDVSEVNAYPHARKEFLRLAKRDLALGA